VARYAGPFGPALIRFVARTRIGVMPETSAMRRGQLPLDTVGEYWYHNWALKASGEVAMHTHLHPVRRCHRHTRLPCLKMDNHLLHSITGRVRKEAHL
jgi:hypothetical protein